jgi:hypothetical protein
MDDMIEKLGRHLRAAAGESPVDSIVDGPPPEAEPATAPIEFVAYAEDCVLSGFVQLSTGRLTDLLNDHDTYVVTDVLFESLADEHPVEVREVEVRRDELLLVHGLGPRGDQDRRHRTRSHPVAVQLGPYHVRGYLHGLPGVDPVQTISRREPMVPLTEAWIEVPLGGELQRRRVGTVVINRDRIDWIVPAVVDEVEMPELPVHTGGGKLLKDFTGALFEEPTPST